MTTKFIPNPWEIEGRTHYKVNEKPCATYEGFEFYKLPASVLAVKDGKAVTECVTVNGAKRRLVQKGYLR